MRETGVRMFIEFESPRPLMFNGVAKPVERTDSRIATPGKDQLLCATCTNQLVTDEIRRKSHEGEISTALPYDFVTGSEWYEVCESLEGDNVAIMDVRRNSGLQ
jgi:hypothetical protein